MNLKRLYERLDADVRSVLHATAETAAREGWRAITLEHFLLALLRDSTCGPPLMRALSAAGADAPAVETRLAELVRAEPKGMAGALPAFSESLATLLREAWSLAFDDYADAHVGAVRVLEAFVRRGERWPRLIATLPGLSSLDLGVLAGSASTRAAAQGVPEATDSAYPELSRYGRDLVAAARADEFDPLVGLESQLVAIASILLRRRQNSVAVVGESGVGKSACMLGFVDALARRAPSVPAVLHDAPVWSLDVSALLAGAVVRGALVERLRAIVSEVAGSGMILVADDLHLLFADAGGGGADALRSVLGDGGVRVLATCGWREWRKYIEPDPGLARRIAPVRIQEPDDAEALGILSGLAPAIAQHHGVGLGEAVLECSVSLARRYIVDRHLPDKAIVVLDSACARARMQASAAVCEGASSVVVEDGHVASVVSDLTGVPIGGMLTDVGQMARRLEESLGGRIVGQDDALARCASQARAYLAGLSDRRRPVGALLFAGPSGVGKTETAHALADALFGGRMLSINMSEYQEAHTVSGLKGAPAGYVGYGEGGVLTEGIRRTPYCVVLLDEVEKAHRDVIEMLYQVLDRGWMEDAEGIEADFSNALLILTTNAGDTVVEEAAASPTPVSEEALHQRLTHALRRSFPAAFIGRLQLVPYWPLGRDTLEVIARMRLERLGETYRHSHRASLEFDEGVRGWLVEQVRSTPQGARFLDGIIAKSIRPALADHILECLGEARAPGDLCVVFEDEVFGVRAAQEAVSGEVRCDATA